jgi:hypothetical protein
MKLKEIEHEALLLDERERAVLAASLLETLPPPGMDVSDEEVLQRDAEAETGRVKSISHQEFVRRVRKARAL